MTLPTPSNEVGNWDTPKKILVILAHPDDPEFFCGATLACWASAGHYIQYCLLTSGDKGTRDRSLTPQQIAAIRQNEQRAAASVIGAKEVCFLDFPDGYLVPDLALRKAITRLIRKERPDVLVTCDPTHLYPWGTRLNHPDHRAAGQATLDAVYPPARDHLYFPDLLEEGLEPHIVHEVWVSLTGDPNVTLDVTEFWETKIRALWEHKSQIADPEELAARMRSRLAPGATAEAPRYVETFRRLELL